MQPEKKARKSHRSSTDDDDEGEDIPENRYDVSMFLDLECHQGGVEPIEDDETSTSSELLFFDCCFSTSSVVRNMVPTSLTYA